MPWRHGSPSSRRQFLRLLGVACASLACGCATTPSYEVGVKPGEEVLLFPTAADFDVAASRWTVPIRGWIHTPPSDAIWTSRLARALLEALDLDDDALAQAIFRARVGWFLAGGEEDRHLVVRVGTQQVTTDPSGPNGLFLATTTFSQDEAARNLRAGVLPTAVVDATGRSLGFEGFARLVGPHGVSVISDIDDTIKESNVLSKRALVANTFLNPFEATPGMAPAYAAWADRGAVFHYVSASPWQLYPSLTQFLAEAEFPAGIFHLREIGFGDRSFLDIFDAPADTKVPMIADIMRRWPQRRWILVGDSGEQDPEIYARIHREFLDRVLHVFIRNVTRENEDAVRYQKAFADVPRERWTVFVDPAVLATRVALPPARSPSAARA